MCLEGMSREPWASGLQGKHLSLRTCLGQKCRRSKFLLCLLDSSRFFKPFISKVSPQNPGSQSKPEFWHQGLPGGRVRDCELGGRQKTSFCGSVTCRPSMFPGHLGITKACTQHCFCLMILSPLTCRPIAFSSCLPH